MAKSYRKKPVMIEAVQWTGENHAEMCEFIDPEAFEIIPRVGLVIHTLEGDHYASPGDYIIKGINGEFYPCKPDIFAKTYESATLTPPNEPLTLEQLRQMDGEPVYIIVDDGYEPLEMWALIDVPEKDHIVLINNIGGRSAYYSDDDLERDHITVYRRPPEGEA